jgi:hypothetical protein
MLNERLSFLNEVLAPKKDKYLNAQFLKNHFDENFWIVKLDDKTDYIIDFKISLADGSMLTDSNNKKTLKTLKYWIIENVYKGDAHLNTKHTIARRINSVLTIFDCLNIFDVQKLIPKTGFNFINSNNFKYILDQLAEDSDKFENIYGISSRLYKVFKKISKNNSFHINKSLEDLTIEEINFFIQDLKEQNLKIKDLFPDTLLNPTKWPEILKEASTTRTYLNEFPRYFREKRKSPLSNKSLIFYKNAIKTLEELVHKFNHDNTFSFPNLVAFENVQEFIVNTKSNGRFETYPSAVIFDSFKSAIEFHFNYGDDIVNSFVNFITTIKEKNINTENFSYRSRLKKIFSNSLTPKLKQLGVTELKMETPVPERFIILRKNYYFFDLLKVYYGAVQFVTGALMARRQSELAGLIANECIDDINNVLLFKRSKSTKGLFGTRDMLALPIDPLVIGMIRNLEKIHTVIGGKNKLFAMPSLVNPTKIKEDTSGNYYGQNLDLFMDYIEAPLIEGKRLYIRQHQLRRFFAMAFFWGSGFGSMDTLRWFMGHTDVQHLYHYITESTPGEVLRSVKAQYVAEEFVKYHDLAQLIKERYNTDNFDIIETEELAYYIESLLEDGSIAVEPDFLKDDHKNEFEIVVKILKKDN